MGEDAEEKGAGLTGCGLSELHAEMSVPGLRVSGETWSRELLSKRTETWTSATIWLRSLMNSAMIGFKSRTF